MEYKSTLPKLNLKIKKLPNGKIPLTKPKDGSCGYDLRSIETKYIPYGSSAVFKTGLKMSFSKHYVADARCRSGLGFKHSVLAFPGVIDSSYRGEVMVKMFNHGAHSSTNDSKGYLVKAGDKICQIVFSLIAVEDFKVVDELEASNRGEKGFGSSGK